jgi:peptide/nickel transport system substrate-binding protein
MRVVPRHLIDSIPRVRLAAHPLARSPVGNGPYRFGSWRAQEMIDLSADTAFFLGRPGISRAVFRVTGDVSTAVTQIVAGEADLLDYVGGPDEVQRISAVPQFRIETRPASAYIYLGFNLRDGATQRPHPLFGNRELRRALVQGVDRASLVQSILGEYGRIPVGPVSRMTPLGNDTTIPQPAYDAAQARATLDSLGWTDANGDGVRERGGRKLEFELLVPSSSPNRVRSALIVQEQLKLLGVAVSMKSLEYNVFQDRTTRHRFDAAMLNWGEDPSPSGIRQVFVSSAYREANYGGYSNPQFDQLVDQAFNAREPSAARTKWREAFALINSDAPVMWLYTPLQPTAIHRRYANVTIQPDQWLRDLWTWRIQPGQMIARDRVGAVTAASP